MSNTTQDELITTKLNAQRKYTSDTDDAVYPRPLCNAWLGTLCLAPELLDVILSWNEGMIQG